MPTTIAPDLFLTQDKPWNKELKTIIRVFQQKQGEQMADQYIQALLGESNETILTPEISRLNHGIKNVRTQLQTWQIGSHQVPITLNETEYDNSYVCSPYTAYICYAKDELGLLKSLPLRIALRGAIKLAGNLFRLAEINHTVSINNWLFSTNLIPNWQGSEIALAKQQLIEQFPEHSLSIRSLNRAHHSKLMDQLVADGWLLMPARQVYLFDADNRSWWQRNHTKKDQSLLRKLENGKLPLSWVQPEEHQPQDFPKIKTCFDQLFIEKHSKFNPQFTAEFLYKLHQNHWMEFHSIRDSEGQIVASIGLFTQQNTLTTPIVGYDTRLPKTLGLYRLLMAILLRLTYQRQQPLNLSSGAGHFKRARGGQAEIEYTAFYTQHLSTLRHQIHKQFAQYANRFGPRILQENEI